MTIPPLKIPPSNDPLQGNATGTGAGVIGTSEAGNGVYGASGVTTNAVTGPVVAPASAYGVYGWSGSSDGVHGETTSQTHAGVSGTNNSAFPGTAILGYSPNGYGVRGVNGDSGLSPNAGCGVWGDSADHNGLFGSSKGDDGVHGETTSKTHAGVSGVNNSAWPCVAVGGSSNAGYGVKGINEPGSGKSPNYPCGVWGDSAEGIGVYGSSKSGAAGFFDGNVTVAGDQLWVAGNINVHGDVNVDFGGDVKLAGADCAELFDLKTLEAAEPGTVMVIDDDGTLRQSEKAYDRAVAGVVSGAGAFRPGIVLGQHADNDGRAAIALVGKVYCKVDADAGPIAVGDLLTSSDTPGHAMKASDPLQAFGAVIGKALSNWHEGTGLIPILVALN